MDCQVLNGALTIINSTLFSFNDTFSGTVLSASNKFSIQNSLAQATPSNNATKLFRDAKPTLEKVLSLIVCRKDDQLRFYTDSSSVGLPTPISPFSYMSKHKSGCLNVQRVDSIKKKTANAFSFRALFVSPQSEESKFGSYTAIKQQNGKWLFNWSAIDAL
ncbi:hypothetical protein FHQ26_07025 [Testudinibacter sp. TR-2022]|uniref:hypothetical protein n=1 Tax=Testudinibacter sp. TR-2022 TaxID=2585029 RepID=UPI001117B288|nr:hypothetical protein [Testudinibacter sp. TR-2022]TNH08035.1 hypothetical protein FHQ25_10125 [Testudinibacter sp. TR-2022]TNH09523.1 hypothetical protein FHQ26_07025 [Testudinibacter sp. TR-2022]TNH11015.1 hypothetical protein FIA56_11755 [Testudinibacter sp. TR-2022]TNH15384.1 hypothetical protein FHQ23_10210 [Testudinibacter sp. TR-2022]